MNHHWVRPPSGGVFCVNCPAGGVCDCSINLNGWNVQHADSCPLQLSAMPPCVPVLVTSEALMFAERSIPWPEELPHEQTLSDGDGDLG